MIAHTKTPAIHRLRKVGVSAWIPREKVSLSAWCEKNLRLSRMWEATGGLFNLEENPFVNDILDAFLDPTVYRITIKKSTQVGGTLSLIAAMIALSELDPAPAMVMLPDATSATELRDRTYGNAAEGLATRHKVPPQRMWNNRHIDFGSCRVYLAWSGSAQRMRGRACKRVFRSETDVYGQPSKVQTHIRRPRTG